MTEQPREVDTLADVLADDPLADLALRLIQQGHRDRQVLLERWPSYPRKNPPTVNDQGPSTDN